MEVFVVEILDNAHQKTILLRGDSLSRYIDKLNIPLQTLSVILENKQMGDELERLAIQDCLEKFKTSLNCLSLKHKLSDTGLEIDAVHSGFPTYYEFSLVAVDKRTSDEKKSYMLPQLAIKRKMIDHIFSKKKDCQNLLSDMYTRVYYDRVSTVDIFQLLNLGRLIKTGEQTYMYYWSMIDSQYNTPCIYVLNFESSYPRPLEESQDLMKILLETIHSYGAIRQNLLVTATGIDNSLPFIQPKILKRFSLSSFCAHDIVTNHVCDETRSLLSMGQEGRRFLFRIDEEAIVSSHQEKRKKGLFSSDKGKVVEIFHLSPDPKLRNQGVSLKRSYVILPYELHQKSVNMFNDFDVFSFDTKGDINHV